MSKVSGWLGRTSWCWPAIASLLFAVPVALFTKIGGEDLLALWSGTTTWLQGGNPYSAEDLQIAQRAVGWSREEVQIFLNPPWGLGLLAPLGVMGFDVARCFVIFLSALCFLVIPGLVQDLFGGTLPRSPRRALLAWLSTPALHCLLLGQLSLILTASLLLSLRFSIRQQPWRASALLVPLALKPQLFLIVGLVLALKQPRMLFRAFLLAVIVTAAVTAYSPGIFNEWLEQEFSPLQWQTSTLVTMVRLWLQGASNVPPTWPVFIVPAIGVILCCTWMHLTRRTSNTTLHLVSGLLFSLAFAPYAYLYDYTLLMIPHVLFVLGLPNRAAGTALLLSIAVQLSSILAAAMNTSLEIFWYVPLAYLFIWCVLYPSIRHALTWERVGLPDAATPESRG